MEAPAGGREEGLAALIEPAIGHSWREDPAYVARALSRGQSAATGSF